jgi:hypothetical protein
VRQCGEGNDEQAELSERCRLRNTHETVIADPRAPHGQNHLHEADEEGEHQREVTKLDDHGRANPRITSSPRPAAGP